MFLKFVLFVLTCYYLNVVHGFGCRLSNITQSRFIAKRFLFKGDVIEISISNLQVNDPEHSKVPLMMISVMKDTTLGYDIDPFFPFVKEKVPALNLDAAKNNRDFILSPSTVGLKIDFQTKTLINDPFSSLIDLYPNTSSIVRDNTCVCYETEKLIEMTSSELNGTVLYNFTFAFPIDNVESEGLYKIYFHSFVTIEMESRWKVSSVGILWHLSVTEMLCCYVRILLFVIYLLIWANLFTKINIHFLPRDLTQLVLITTFATLFNRFSIIFIQLYNVVKRKEMPEQVKPTSDLQSLITSTIINLLWMGMLLLCCLLCLLCWKTWNRSDIFHKIDKVLYISVLLVLIYSCPHNNDISIDDFTIVENYIRFLMLMLVMLKMTDTEREIVVFRKRFWRTRCMYAGYFLIVSFKLVLVTMTWLEVPFYFYFIQIAIEDLLSILPLWIILESTRYHEYIYAKVTIVSSV